MLIQDKVRRIVAERTGHDWCLFVDRDGVINRRIVDGYVRTWADFEWLPGARSALKELSDWAPYLVVVTNQQGVGKQLMSLDDLTAIHQLLQSDLAQVGVAVDGFQVCPHLESQQCGCRKPQTGLVLDWLSSHPNVEPSLSVVVGDSPSDMELADNVATAVGGCASIAIGSRAAAARFAHASFNSLSDFSVAVRNARGKLGL